MAQYNTVLIALSHITSMVLPIVILHRAQRVVDKVVSACSGAASVPVVSAPEMSPAIQQQDVFWSPSEVIGLSTPPSSLPNTPAQHTLDLPATQSGVYRKQAA